jgi:Uma2 family endonuclease
MLTIDKVVSKITLEEFLKLPETKPAREYFNGEIEQKPIPNGPHSLLQGEFRNV